MVAGAGVAAGLGEYVGLGEPLGDLPADHNKNHDPVCKSPSQAIKIRCHVLLTLAVSEKTQLIPGLGVVAGDEVAEGLGEYVGALGLLTGLGLLAGLGEYVGDVGLTARHIVSSQSHV